MANQRLTNGALLRYLRGNTTEKAILQVTGIKTIDSKTDDPSGSSLRYRLMLSDGKNTFSCCMLGIQMNKLIETNSLKENSIIRVDRILVNSIDKQNGRVMLMLYEFEVLQTDCERIGDPVALPLTDIINSNTTTTDRSETNNNQILASSISTMNTYGQVSNTLSTSTDTRNNLKGTIDKERILDINSLNPYINKWTIKARISNKSQVRNFQNTRGPGKLFSCDLVDQSGEISAKAFNAECDKFYSILKVGEVYYITKASLKMANRQFNTTDNDYEMTLNHDTLIEHCDSKEEGNVPQLQFNFIPICEIANRPVNTMCDVIGVVKTTSDIQTIVGKATQKQFNKREIVLVDEKASITVSLWGEQAENFDGSTNPILAFKGVKIGDYNGRNLSCMNSTLICQNPTETHRTEELRVWYDNEGKFMDLPDLSKLSSINDRYIPTKTLSQIMSEGFGLGDKADYVNVRAVIISIKKDSVVYMMCPEDKCSKKVIDGHNGTYQCEKCNKTYNHFKWSYMILAEISDDTGTQWITIFQNEAETLLGITADEYGKYKMNQNESFIDDIICKAMNREHIFKLRVKMELYNDQRKLRFTCMSISNIDWSTYGKHLLDEIHHLRFPSN